MSHQFVVYGSWRLRHNEPLSPQDQHLVLYPLRQALDPTAYTLLLDLDEALDRSAGLGLSLTGERIALPAALAVMEVDSTIPLGILDDHRGPLTHATLRIDLDRTQFLRVPSAYEWQPAAPLWRQIYDFNAASHLYFANHECYFIKSRDTIELEQKFHFETTYSYMRICQKLYAALDAGRFQGFLPHYNDEFQPWSFDNYLYDIVPKEDGDAGYVSMIFYCKQKTRWDDPLYMFKKKIYETDRLERWEKNYHNQWIDGDKQAALEKFFGYELSPLPPWRRTRYDVVAEGTANGNVFLIEMDDCRVHDAPPSTGRLQQCEIEYLTTRGVPNERMVEEEFWSLVDQVHAFLAELGLGPSRTYYSKLSWLRDFVAAS